MKMFFQRRVAIVLALLSMLTLGVGVANAQNRAANGFRISPVRSELTIDKGKSETFVVSIQNPTDIATIAKPVINDFVASDDETGEPRLILDENTPSPKNSFKDLVQPLQPVNLGPKERKDVNVTVAVPSDGNAGGYYGAIRYIPAAQNDQSTIGLTASVGTIVLVRVPGDLTERLDLVQLSGARGGDATSLFTSGNPQILTRLSNEGDIHEKPFGKILVKDMFGKVVADVEFNNTDPRANILPGSTRKFTNDLPKKSWLGRYTIEANLGYTQGGGELITGKASFWYLPPWSLAVLAVLVLAVVGGIYWIVRKTSGRKKHHGPKRK